MTGEHGGGGDLGPVYTTGRAFRARAEARQREYRAEVLRVGWSKFGHWLDDAGVESGRNFVTPIGFEAARTRAAKKGVGAQTFRNMCTSQAMCFNIFAPLEADHRLAADVLGPLLGVTSVEKIVIEHTPASDIFRDQSGRGGVDCDVLIEATGGDGVPVLVTIETKFVEEGFSTCGYREKKRIKDGKPYCPDDIAVRADHSACLYVSQQRRRGLGEGFAYWERTQEFATLGMHAVPERGCPFAGAEWQLWVNHTLAHAEAARHAAREPDPARRKSTRAMFAVCAPAANEALLRDGILDRFRARLADPRSFRFVPLDALLERIQEVAGNGERRAWTDALAARYANI